MKSFKEYSGKAKEEASAAELTKKIASAYAGKSGAIQTGRDVEQ